MDQEQRCFECRFWREPLGGIPVGSVLSSLHGQCERYPTVVEKNADSGCGEWSGRPGASIDYWAGVAGLHDARVAKVKGGALAGALGGASSPDPVPTEQDYCDRIFRVVDRYLSAGGGQEVRVLVRALIQATERRIQAGGVAYRPRL